MRSNSLGGLREGTGGKPIYRAKQGPSRAGKGCGAASVEGKTQSAQRQSLFAKGRGLGGEGWRRIVNPRARVETARRDTDWEDLAEPPLCVGRDLDRAVTVRPGTVGREHEPASAGGPRDAAT